MVAACDFAVIVLTAEWGFGAMGATDLVLLGAQSCAPFILTAKNFFFLIHERGPGL